MSNQRVVTVFSSKGVKQKIETDVQTWGELRPLVEEHFDLENLQATENINKTTLEHADAILPTANFVLFLRAIKTKSGADYASMSFTDLRACLSDEDKQALKEKTGKNWTRVKRTVIEELLAAKNNTTSEIVEAETEIVEAETEEVVEEIEETPELEGSVLNPANRGEEAIIEEEPKSFLERVKEIKSLVKSIKKEHSAEEIKDTCDVVLVEVKSLKRLLKEIANKSPEEIENEELKKELEALNRGF